MQDQKTKGISRTVRIGGGLIIMLFIAGVSAIIVLNLIGQGTATKDLGVLFASMVAATGVITTASIAYQASHHLEAEKDRNERSRKRDEERVMAETALVTLHVIATRLDGYYLRMKDAIEALQHALKNQNLKRFHSTVNGMPSIPIPFPLLEKLDTRFMRLPEQQAVRNMEVDVYLIASATKDIRSMVGTDIDANHRILDSLGPEAFYSAHSDQLDHLIHCNRQLFATITPYINQRKASTVPDEFKLQMLLGYLDPADPVKIHSLDDARERIRIVASRLLQDHVEAKDIRDLMSDVANGIRDEDSISFANS
jgi:hypothetical protein